MTTYIILLRGVTPSDKNKVPVAQLRQVLARAGFSHVRTYIQAGNVIVDTEFPASETANRIHHLIKEYIGPDLAVVVRTGVELQKMLSNNPFQEGYDLSRVFFALFAQLPVTEKYKRTPHPGLWWGETCSQQTLPICIFQVLDKAIVSRSLAGFNCNFLR